MPVKSYKPTTPSRRYMSVLDSGDLTPKKKLPKKPRRLTKSFGKTGGRNVYGRITSYQRGGGHKRLYRMIDFMRDKLDIPGKVLSIEYDPNRTSRIALIGYADGEKRYILAPVGLKVGDSILASDAADIQPGNCLSLEAIPVGTIIHNLEVEPGHGSRIARTAGGMAQLVAKEGTYFAVKMPSGEMRKIHKRCRAVIGQLGNLDHENVTIGKAGRSRWLGIRPHTRGVATNPVDHPMGGGEGKATGGHPRSPWGQYAKGYKTRNKKRTDAFIIRRRNSNKGV